MHAYIVRPAITTGAEDPHKQSPISGYLTVNSQPRHRRQWPSNRPGTPSRNVTIRRSSPVHIVYSERWVVVADELAITCRLNISGVAIDDETRKANPHSSPTERKSWPGGAARQDIDIGGIAMRRDGAPHLISACAWLLRGQDENAHRANVSQAARTRRGGRCEG